MTCRTCKHLCIEPDKAGRIVVHMPDAWPCDAPATEPILPASITDRYGWHWPPSRTYMSLDRGEGCPSYSVRTSAPAPVNDVEWLKQLARMNLLELFDFVMSSPEFLTDGYYSKFRTVILKRYEEVRIAQESP